MSAGTRLYVQTPLQSFAYPVVLQYPSRRRFGHVSSSSVMSAHRSCASASRCGPDTAVPRLVRPSRDAFKTCTGVCRDLICFPNAPPRELGQSFQLLHCGLSAAAACSLVTGICGQTSGAPMAALEATLLCNAFHVLTHSFLHTSVRTVMIAVTFFFRR